MPERGRKLLKRPIHHFIVDFYCATLRLVIEVDGDSHFSDEGMKVDAKPTAVLNGYGLRVARAYHILGSNLYLVF